MRRAQKKVWSLVRNAREIVFPSVHIETPAVVKARHDARDLWNDLFAPLRPLVVDADILEIGFGDGRVIHGLLNGMTDEGPARSAVGVGVGYHAATEGIGLPAEAERFQLHSDIDNLQGFDAGSFDLVLCRDLQSVFPASQIEIGLKALYELVRPGGEALLRVRCFDPSDLRLEAAGYGVMTPSSWIMLMMRAGFEVGEVQRNWRDAERARDTAERLPDASDEERMTSELRCRLIRPWESWELDALWSQSE